MGQFFFLLSLCLGCAEGDVQIVGGTNGLEGLVEVCRDNEWGTVCDQMWDNTAASVACRQLGLASTGTYVHYLQILCDNLINIQVL